MKRFIVLAAAIAAIPVAQAFFKPIENPVGRPSKCVLQLTWDASQPTVVSQQWVWEGFPTTRVCRPGKALAMATALQGELAAPEVATTP
jgi:hypothetical protein